MALFTTNENLPIQEQISMLQDQLNMVMGSYQQTKSGLIYYGDGNMPAGSQIQIYEDGSYGADNLIYDDSQTVLNADNVQKALEKISADTSNKKKFSKFTGSASYEELIEEGWVSYAEFVGSPHPLGWGGVIHKISIIKQGRVLVMDVGFEFNDYITALGFSNSISQNSEFGWLFTITREDLCPDRSVPVFIYRRDKQGDGITGLEYNASKSTVGIDPDGKVSVRYIDESWLEYIEFRTIYVTAK